MFNVISLKNGLENVVGFSFGGVSAGFKKDGANVRVLLSDGALKFTTPVGFEAHGAGATVNFAGEPVGEKFAQVKGQGALY